MDVPQPDRANPTHLASSALGNRIKTTINFSKSQLKICKFQDITKQPPIPTVIAPLITPSSLHSVEITIYPHKINKVIDVLSTILKQVGKVGGFWGQGVYYISHLEVLYCQEECQN